jgi:hypothetical protein
VCVCVFGTLVFSELVENAFTDSGVDMHRNFSDGVFYSGHNALLRAKAKLFNATRDRKGLLEVFERLPVPDYLLGGPVPCPDGGNIPRTM